jgi:hypothetical protein
MYGFKQENLQRKGILGNFAQNLSLFSILLPNKPERVFGL